ncbi:hypothetical protein evm_014146 [Chilo suppressalis]|nr:hypothetical protein evm_014146 [Chilo suppressalis]
MLIRLGEYNMATKVDCVDGVCADPIIKASVGRVFVHPDYGGREHDIAIIRLKNEVPCTDFIRPICLPSAKLDSFAIFDATGWGEEVSIGLYSPVKKIIPLPLWSYNECREVYKNDVIPSSVICAGGIKGMDTCRGDSGGPLVYQKRFIELYGVTSLGPTQCGREGAPGIYTSVVDHLDWIHEVLGVT